MEESYAFSSGHMTSLWPMESFQIQSGRRGLGSVSGIWRRMSLESLARAAAVLATREAPEHSAHASVRTTSDRMDIEEFFWALITHPVTYTTFVVTILVQLAAPAPPRRSDPGARDTSREGLKLQPQPSAEASPVPTPASTPPRLRVLK